MKKKIFFLALLSLFVFLILSCKKAAPEKNQSSVQTPQGQNWPGATFLSKSWTTETSVITWISSDGTSPSKAEYEVVISVPADSFDIFFPRTAQFLAGTAGGSSVYPPTRNLVPGAYASAVCFSFTDEGNRYLDGAAGTNASGSGRLGVNNISAEITSFYGVETDPTTGWFKIPKGTTAALKLKVVVTEPGNDDLKGKYSLVILSINGATNPQQTKVTAWSTEFKTSLPNPGFK